jgi:hypothetical protein
MAQAQAQETTEDTTSSVSKSTILDDKLYNGARIIYSDFTTSRDEYVNSILRSKIDSKDQILVAYICNIEYLDILLIYDNTNNNLVIIDTNKVTNFLIYNENIIDRYTFISFYNKSIYGQEIDSNLVKYLFQLALTTLNSIINKITDQNILNNYLKLIHHLNNIKYNTGFTFTRPIPTLNFLKIELDTSWQKSPHAVPLGRLKKDQQVYMKYIKYKTKYLNFKNIKLYPVYHSNNIIKDSDSFYKKYTKYKTKYLQLKNKI